MPGGWAGSQGSYLGRDHLQSGLERSFWGPASTTLGAWNYMRFTPSGEGTIGEKSSVGSSVI